MGGFGLVVEVPKGLPRLVLILNTFFFFIQIPSFLEKPYNLLHGFLDADPHRLGAVLDFYSALSGVSGGTGSPIDPKKALASGLFHILHHHP